MNGSFQQLTIDVPDEIKDAIIGELSEHGAAGIWESGEPLPGFTRLEVYFNASLNSNENLQEVKLRVQSVFERANVSLPSITVGAVEDRDWLGEWKKSYVSFPIGRGFFIIPSWSDSPCPADRLAIRIDPGQAFGTGTHETTQLTLGLLEEISLSLNPATPILDLGTGSGILVIAARLLGFKRVAGCDIDPDSIRVAVENIERNVDVLPVFCGSIDAVLSESVELLLCNLTADVIISLFPEINRTMRPGGSAILSGILVEQRSQIDEAVTCNGWRIDEQRTLGEWIALRIQKPAGSHGH